ncbi:MAG: Brix domain-containing protein [Sulfolobales archaeon]
MTLLVTTSRNPSRRTRSFVKDLTSVIKGLVRINRGKKTLNDLLNLMRVYDSQGLVVVFEKKGNPSALNYYVLTDGRLERVMMIKLASIKLLREIRGAQKPFNTCEPIIDGKSFEGEVPTDVIDAVRIFLGVRSTTTTTLLNKLVRLKFRYEGQYTSLTFVCLGSERVCGPELRILKVVKYGLQGIHNAQRSR